MSPSLLENPLLEKEYSTTTVAPAMVLMYIYYDAG